MGVDGELVVDKGLVKVMCLKVIQAGRGQIEEVDERRTIPGSGPQYMDK